MQDNTPAKKPLAVCATHGLRYDPAQDVGCVLCRKMQAQQENVAPRGKSHWPFAIALLAIIVSGGFVVRAIRNAREAATLAASQAEARLPVPKYADVGIRMPPPYVPPEEKKIDLEGLAPEVAGKPNPAWDRDIYAAAGGGSGLAVQHALNAGIDINGNDPKQIHTPLTLAIANGHADLAIWMIRKGADVHRDEPLLHAIKRIRTDVVDVLLEHGADPNYAGKLAKPWSDRPIQLMVDKSDVGAVDALARHGADVDVYDTLGRSLLSRAFFSSSERRLHMIQWIIDHLKDRRELDRQKLVQKPIYQYDNASPIGIAASEFHADIVRLLVLNGANVRGEAVYNPDYGTIIDGVARTYEQYRGHEVEQRDTIHTLIELGADASLAFRRMTENPQWNDYQPWAEEDFIRKSAAKPTFTTIYAVVDEGKNTHLHWAAALGEPELIKRLIDRDMDLDRLSEGPGKLALTYDAGSTPLHLAAAFGHPDAVDALLAAGAKASAIDTKGRAPKDVVCKKNSNRYDFFRAPEEERCARVTASLAKASR